MKGLQCLLVVCLLAGLSLSGCMGEDEEEKDKAKTLAPITNPCYLPTQSLSQSLTEISVNDETRLFRLTVPQAQPGVKLPVIIAFHGGDGSQEDFQQQNEFDSLADQEKFIMAYAIAEDDRTAAEGEWFLNTAATSRDDNDFAEEIVDQLSESYCVDSDRLYAIGYSLGSMFTYEVACQLNHKFAAVASFAGTMPVNPETCELAGSMAVLHIHGKLDYIIDYDEDWDWKDGEHEGVGTMSNIPGMIDSWAERAGCKNENSHDDFETEHIVHSGCMGNTRIEHYGMQFQEHTWPEEVADIPTYRLIWSFLSEFTN